MSPINAFSVEELYSPQFSDSFQENTGYWHEPSPHESPVEQKEQELSKFATESQGGSKRHKSSGSSSFNTESGDVSINLNTNAGDNDKDEVQEIRRTIGRDNARAARKNKGSKASGSSSMNDDALARLMVTEMTAQEKEERLVFIEINGREVECREREVAVPGYRARQKDIRFYLQLYDHLTGDQRMAMDKSRVAIKAKYLNVIIKCKNE
nr:hypothetical protein [Tanacetum cinerariifolium]